MSDVHRACEVSWRDQNGSGPLEPNSFSAFTTGVTCAHWGADGGQKNGNGGNGTGGAAGMVCESGYTKKNGRCVENPDDAGPLCPAHSDPSGANSKGDKGDGQAPAGVGNPIHSATGEKIEQAVDYVMPGVHPFEVSRTYRSMLGSEGKYGLGLAWSFDHESTLIDKGSWVDLRVSLEQGVTEKLVAVGPAFGSYRGDRQFDAAMNYVTTPSPRWVMRLGDGRVFTYIDIITGRSHNIRLYQIEWPDGYRRTYDYDGATKRIDRITDLLGRRLWFTYANDRVTQIQFSDGTILDYEYDYINVNSVDLIGTERLIKVTRRNLGGVVRETYYLYEKASDRWALTGITDARGVRYATFDYDSGGRAILSEHAGGADRVTVAYDHATKSRTFTNAAGRQTTYNTQFTNGRTRVSSVNGLATANCLASNSSYVYSGNGDVTQMTDAEGHVYSYIRNSRGLQTQRTEAVGTPQARVVSTEWHPTLTYPTKITTPELETSFDYGATGLLAGVTETDRATNLQRTWTYSYLSAELAPFVPLNGSVTIANQNFDLKYVAGWTTVTGQPARYAYSAFSMPAYGNNGTYGLSGAQTSSSNVSYQVSQTILLDPFDFDAIDAGIATLRLEWNQLATTANAGYAGLIFLDVNGAAIGAGQTAPPVANNPNWSRRNLQMTAPAGARGVKISLYCDYVSGIRCDVWHDDIVLTYTPTPGPLQSARPARLASIDGPLPGSSDTVSYEYDAIGNLTAVVDELGHRTEMLSYNSVGLPTSIRDPNGLITDLAYDSENRLTSVTANPGGAGEAQTSFQYDAIGQITRIDYPGSPYFIFTYDDARRLTAIENASGERRELGHDAFGRVTSVRDKFSGGATALAQDFQFDELGRLLRSIGAASQTTQFGYDRNDHLTQVTDPRSKVYGNAFDALDRLVRETAPDGGITQTMRRSDGAVSAVNDPESLSTTYARNAWGEITQVSSPDTGVTTYARDQRGLITAMTDARGVTTSYAYDVAGRLLSESFSSAPGATRTYSYDATSPAGNKGVGRLTGASDADVSANYVYDLFGRVSSETRSIDGPGGALNYALQYSYLADGRVSSMTYPSGRVVYYDYAADGAPSAVRMRANAGASDETVMSSIEYRPMAGALSAGMDSDLGPWAFKSGVFGNGLSMTVTHDLDGRPTRLLTAVASATVLDLSLSYDAASNITAMTDAAGARTQSFAYDSMNRLAEATGVYGTIDYFYDKVGNRTALVRSGGTGAARLQTAGYSYASGSHRLASVSGAAGRSFTYLASGQLASDTSGVARTFDYDAEGRMVAANDNGVLVASYNYDALGHQVSKTAGGQTVHFIYDPFGRLIAEHNGATGAALREYVWLGWAPIAMLDHSSGVPVTYYIHTDQVMQPQMMTDASGAVVWNRIATPYGVEVSATGALTQSLRFPGQRADDQSKFNQNWMRDYDPLLGRYVQSDPIGLMGGINTYGYANGNPLSYYDPDGQLAWFLVPAAVAGVGVVADLFSQYLDYCFFGGPTVDPEQALFAGLGLLNPFARFNDAYATGDALGRGDYWGAALAASAFVPGVKGTAKRTRRLGPVADAAGPHTTWKTDPKSGGITRHETWTPNSRKPGGWDSVQSTDISGRPHRNSQTGQPVPTPHTQGPNIPGGVRPALPSEIPGGPRN